MYSESGWPVVHDTVAYIRSSSTAAFHSNCQWPINEMQNLRSMDESMARKEIQRRAY